MRQPKRLNTEFTEITEIELTFDAPADGGAALRAVWIEGDPESQARKGSAACL
jgi:hypothetical protein